MQIPMIPIFLVRFPIITILFPVIPIMQIIPRKPWFIEQIGEIGISEK